MKKIFIKLSQAQQTPYFFAENESDLKAYADHLHGTGFSAYSYDECKSLGFIQEFELDDKRLEKIKKNETCYLWISSNLESHSPSAVIAFSDNMSNLASQVSAAWNNKVTANHLLTQYGVIPEHKLSKVEGWNVLGLKITY